MTSLKSPPPLHPGYATERQRATDEEGLVVGRSSSTPEEGFDIDRMDSAPDSLFPQLKKKVTEMMGLMNLVERKSSHVPRSCDARHSPRAEDGKASAAVSPEKEVEFRPPRSG